MVSRYKIVVICHLPTIIENCHNHKLNLQFTYLCRLLITCANRLDPDLALKHRTRSGSKLFDACKKLSKTTLKENQQTTKKHENYPVGKELSGSVYFYKILDL